MPRGVYERMEKGRMRGHKENCQCCICKAIRGEHNPETTKKLIAGGLKYLKRIKGKTYEEIYGGKENIPKDVGIQPKLPIASKETLEDLYLHQKLTKEQISERLDCSYYLVCVWLENYGIPERSRSEVRKLIWQDEKHVRKRMAIADKVSDALKKGWEKRREREVEKGNMYYCYGCRCYHYRSSRIGVWHRGVK